MFVSHSPQRIHQHPPDSVRSSNLGNGFNQFERKKPAEASDEPQHSPWSVYRVSASSICLLSFLCDVVYIHAFKFIEAIL